MKVRTIETIRALQEAVNSCSRDVWVENTRGERYDLKSEVEQYVAIGALIQDVNEELELFATLPEDQLIMMNFLRQHCA